MSQAPSFPLDAISRHLIRNTADGILIAHQGKLQLINPAAAAMLGVTVESSIGKQIESIFTLNPALLTLFSRSGDQTLEVRLPPDIGSTPAKAAPGGRHRSYLTGWRAHGHPAGRD